MAKIAAAVEDALVADAGNDKKIVRDTPINKLAGLHDQSPVEIVCWCLPAVIFKTIISKLSLPVAARKPLSGVPIRRS